MQKYWPGTVQPPVLKVDQNREPFIYEDTMPDEPAVIAEPVPANAPAGPDQAEANSGRVAANQPDLSTGILIGALVLLLLIALALGWRRWARRGVPQT